MVELRPQATRGYQSWISIDLGQKDSLIGLSRQHHRVEARIEDLMHTYFRGEALPARCTVVCEAIANQMSPVHQRSLSGFPGTLQQSVGPGWPVSTCILNPGFWKLGWIEANLWPRRGQNSARVDGSSSVVPLPKADGLDGWRLRVSPTMPSTTYRKSTHSPQGSSQLPCQVASLACEQWVVRRGFEWALTRLVSWLEAYNQTVSSGEELRSWVRLPTRQEIHST